MRRHAILLTAALAMVAGVLFAGQLAAASPAMPERVAGRAATSAPPRPDLAAAGLSAVKSSFAPRPAALPRRLRVMRWIVPRTIGQPYCWAGTGSYCPNPPGHGYDCSGLVMTAWAHAGVLLPHNAEAMAESGKLIQIPFRDARRGDIATFGPPGGIYHVALVAYAHDGVIRWIYAAQDNHVGYYSTAGFYPAQAWRVR